MASLANQKATLRIKAYMEEKAKNKAEVARQAGIKPEHFYDMLTNRRIMSADEYLSVCAALEKTVL